MKFRFSLALATVMTAAFTAPALAQDSYPRLEIHGYNEIYFHFHDVNKLSFGPGGIRRDGLYVGQTRLSFQPHFNEKMSGMLEVFLFPKDRPQSYVNQMDIVGNGAIASYGPVGTTTGSPIPTIPTLGIGTGRMQVAIRDFLWGDNTFTVGQIRVPFGNWDEFSVHRNFVTMKSHPKTLGFLLRRIDMGMSLDGDIGETPFDYRLALINRSDSPIYNNVNLIDGVARLGVNTPWADLGLNAYVVDQKDAALGTKGAAALDFTVPLGDRFNLLGEYVRQTSSVATTDGVYSRLNYDASDLLPGLRLYTGVDWVDFKGTPAVTVPSTGPRNLQEQLQNTVRDYGATYAVGMRYRFMPSATFGMDYLYGIPQYRDGHLHFRMETYF